MDLAPNNLKKQPPFLFEGNRDEVENVVMNAIEGTLPDDLHGTVYLMTQCGTVNSGGYPFPKEQDGKRNEEFGSPVLNGNGMVFKFNLGEKGKVTVSSKLVKAPSYYADEALGINGPARDKDPYKGWQFLNMGITRMSFFLGPVNYANTAVIPVNFNNDSGVSILATYDTGRPIKLDPNDLEFVTPIGYNKEWVSGFPRFLQAPLPMFETTAHPSWDPIERKLYAVNYTKSAETEASRSFIYELLRHDKNALVKEIEEIAKDYKDHKSTKKAIEAIEKLIDERKEDWVEKKKKKMTKKSSGGFWGWLKKVGEWLKNKLFGWLEKITTTEDAVYLVRFDGDGDLKQWKLLNEDGTPLKIYQCMHQTSITKNHLVLMDSSFKFAFDLLINNPFPHVPIIDEMIRDLTCKAILPSTKVWIVKKSDLAHGNPVVAYAVKGQPIDGLSNEPYGGVPMECVHFTAEYDEPDGNITIYTAHNLSTCLAEWVREYDINYFTKEGYDLNNISNYAVGQMNISSVGKYVMDTKAMAFVPNANKVLREAGNLPDVNDLDGTPINDIGPNTWGIGLYGCRDMISPEIPQSKIDHLFFVNFGTQPALLTQFIHDLYYYETQNGLLDKDDLVKYTECGIPQSLLSIDTETMEIDGYYQFGWGQYPMSVQFIAKPTPTPGVPPGQDGYVWIVGKQLLLDGEGYAYRSQVWIFDAADIPSGPKCVLAAEDFAPCTCLHVAWVDKIDTFKSGYMVDIEEDFNESIKNSFLDVIEQDHYQSFFDTYVYPNFKNKNNN